MTTGEARAAAGDSAAWHAVDSATALARLGSRPGGLGAAEAAARLAADGPNVLPRPPRPGPVAVFLRQFRSPLIYLLLAAAAASLAIGDLDDAGFILIVLVVNALVGASQEWRAAQGAATLARLVRLRAVVRRDGRAVTIDGEALVAGDVVELEAGQRVPADLRLLEARGLRVDESLLTGESEPVDKRAAPPDPGDSGLAERRTLLHAASTVLAGAALGVVVRTGGRTELGRIAGAVGSASAPPPLVVRLERFSRQLAAVVLVSVVGIAAMYWLRGVAPVEIFFVAVALAVSAIPEGLPVAISVALAIAARRMAAVSVIVRRLPAVEGLGACTAIATDKTGTLTLNALTIRRIWLPGLGELAVEGEGYSSAGRVRCDGASTEAAALEGAVALATAGVFTGAASWREDAAGKVEHVGDTVDVAFMALAAKLGLEPAELAAQRAEAEGIPFDAALRFAARFLPVEGELVAYVKGAAEALAPMCAAASRAALLAAAERLAAEGFRVLAVAAGPVAEPRAEALGDLAPLGLVALLDPLRPEVPAAVARCRRAGIRVVMVTGDHPRTALAIGRQLGLAAGADDVVTGRSLAAADPTAFDAAVARATIFARVEPTQKLDIVLALRRAGHFVAVTGDGVNDVPALAAAHVGVAMGAGGTDAARAAADLILADDNFASIVAGIEQGRIAYDNVRKIVLMLCATGAGEVGLFLLAVALGLPPPLLAVQLLWLNLVTNGIQDVALAFERGEPGALDRAPRPPGQPIFDRAMIGHTAVIGAAIAVVAIAFWAALLRQGWSEAEARSLLLLLMVSFENAIVLAARSETRSAFAIPFRANKLIVLAVLGTQALHLLAMHAPPLQQVLGIAPVPPAAWLATVAMAATVLAASELYKRAARRSSART